MCEPVGRQELAAVLRPVAALLALGAERETTIIYIYTGSYKIIRWIRRSVWTVQNILPNPYFTLPIISLTIKGNDQYPFLLAEQCWRRKVWRKRPGYTRQDGSWVSFLSIYQLIRKYPFYLYINSFENKFHTPKLFDFLNYLPSKQCFLTHSKSNSIHQNYRTSSISSHQNNVF